MADRVVIFIDYQNAYMGARDAFHGIGSASQAGQFDLMPSLSCSCGGVRRTSIANSVRFVSIAGSLIPRKARAATQPATGSARHWETLGKTKVITRTLRYPETGHESESRRRGLTCSSPSTSSPGPSGPSIESDFSGQPPACGDLAPNRVFSYCDDVDAAEQAMLAAFAAGVSSAARECVYDPDRVHAVCEPGVPRGRPAAPWGHRGESAATGHLRFVSASRSNVSNERRTDHDERPLARMTSGRKPHQSSHIRRAFCFFGTAGFRSAFLGRRSRVRGPSSALETAPQASVRRSRRAALGTPARSDGTPRRRPCSAPSHVRRGSRTRRRNCGTPRCTL
jgi:hypothetical protein